MLTEAGGQKDRVAPVETTALVRGPGETTRLSSPARLTFWGGSGHAVKMG